MIYCNKSFIHKCKGSEICIGDMYHRYVSKDKPKVESKIKKCNGSKEGW